MLIYCGKVKTSELPISRGSRNTSVTIARRIPKPQYEGLFCTNLDISRFPHNACRGIRKTPGSPIFCGTSSYGNFKSIAHGQMLDGNGKSTIARYLFARAHTNTMNTHHRNFRTRLLPHCTAGICRTKDLVWFDFAVRVKYPVR